MTNTEIPEISDDIKAKCLIRTVDDDPAMREALEFMLTAEGVAREDVRKRALVSHG